MSSSSFHNRNPLWNENTLIGRVVAIMALVPILIVGLLVMRVDRNDRNDAKQGFAKEDFTVVFVVEDETDAIAKVNKACGGAMTGQPTSTFKEPEGLRELWRVDQNKFRSPNGLPTPMYMQKMPPAFPGFASDVRPVYAVFKHPDALGKFRRWAKENGYRNTDFPMEWGVYNDNHTKEVIIDKKGSTLMYVAFFEGTKDRSFMWDGAKIFNLSSNDITGQVGGVSGKQHYIRFVNWLLTVAE
jgi:hypothetical protein